MNLEELNTREAVSATFARLIVEADAGTQSPVSEAEALEFRRDQYGLSAQRWAMVLGLTPQKYSEIAAGKLRMPINSIARAVAVGVPVEPLLAGRTDQRREITYLEEPT